MNGKETDASHILVSNLSFQIFSKIRGDNREWMFISGVNDAGDKWEKFWGTTGINFFHILLRA